MRRYLSSAIAAAALAVPTLIVPQAAEAAAYPGTKCVADKLKTASGTCKAVLNAWAKFVGGGGTDTATRDATLTKASEKMTAAWAKAESKAAAKGADCVETTLSDGDMQTLISDAVDGIVNDVTAGLNLGDKNDAKCGSALLKEAAKKCAAILKNESGFIGNQAKGTAKRDAGNTKADQKFDAKVTTILASCPTTATLGSLDQGVDDLTADVIQNSIVAPGLDDTQFTTISPPQNGGVVYAGETLTPQCAFFTDYHFFVKKGTVNKLVMYYQGGGACWSTNTCVTLGTFDQNVNPAGSDNPNNTTTGFGDLTNPNNPFKDWHIVFVSYCSGDIHFGDSNQNYSGTPTRHKGWHNSRIAEKFAREHFVAPEEVFVTGSSAGAYGAFFNAPLHLDVWPAAKFSVLGDAGNGIITPDFLNNNIGYGFARWNFEAHLPTHIPGIAESISEGTGIPAYTKAVADFFPNAAWAHYTTSYDGGTGGQTGFYNVMKNSNPDNVLNWIRWWDYSCEWNDIMRSQAIATAALSPNNYRYYIGTGSRHTMYGSNKVYTDTSGNVPTIVDWINAMRDRTPAWTNVECDSPTSCGTVQPGDPLPARECEGGTNDGGSCNSDSACPGGVCGYEEPFSIVGSDIVISCP